MITWSAPAVPALPGPGLVPEIWDESARRRLPAATGPDFRLYVCGVTPYDAAHLGHARTYLLYDILRRAVLDAGVRVETAQNVTDVDDPLLERAARDHENWMDLATRETDRYRTDMAWLRLLPPDHFEAVSDRIERIAAAVRTLQASGMAYGVPTPDALHPGDQDVYFDTATADVALNARDVWRFGQVSHLDRPAMLAASAEHGGDPDRTGKRDPLDPLLWRAARAGEPSWTAPGLPTGRPGWHIECSLIAGDALGGDFDVQGGGSDLVFPHHEYSALHTAALTGAPMARIFSHVGMVAYQGEKMSKSLGNLVFVGQLRDAGMPASAVRAALLDRPYRDDWEWHEADAAAARARAARWAAALAESTAASENDGDGAEADPAATATGPESVEQTCETTAGAETVQALRAALAADLDTPAALRVLDGWARAPRPGSGPLVARAADALLGIDLDECRPAPTMTE
jgi:L-cysteine:1D-myo-inositol 2-amino-2-deoxy-alpha-D-glucopyranoside ligase